MDTVKSPSAANPTLAQTEADNGPRACIKRLGYSVDPWRLVGADGREIYWSQPFDHSFIGKTLVTTPVCGKTRSQATERAMAVLEWLMRANAKLASDLAEARSMLEIAGKTSPAALGVVNKSDQGR